MLLFQALVVAENKNEMKNISQLPLLYTRLAANLFLRRFSGFEKKDKKYRFCFFSVLRI